MECFQGSHYPLVSGWVLLDCYAWAVWSGTARSTGHGQTLRTPWVPFRTKRVTTFLLEEGLLAFRVQTNATSVMRTKTACARVRFCVDTRFHGSWARIRRVELLGYVLTRCRIFEELTELAFKALNHLTLPASVCSTFSPTRACLSF